MRFVNITIDSNDRVSYDTHFAGQQGEHNATTLVITLPDRMVKDIDYHIISFYSNTNFYPPTGFITEEKKDIYREGNIIYCPLKNIYTQKESLYLTVEAYKNENDVPVLIKKTPKIGALILGNQTNSMDIVEKDPDMIGIILNNFKSRHNHYNKNVLDKLAEDEDGNLLFNGESISVGDDVDLSGLATKDELSEKVDKVSGKSLISDAEITRLAGVDNYDDTAIWEEFDNKANSKDIPTKTSQLTNDSGYVTEKDIEKDINPTVDVEFIEGDYVESEWYDDSGYYKPNSYKITITDKDKPNGETFEIKDGVGIAEIGYEPVISGDSLTSEHRYNLTIKLTNGKKYSFLYFVNDGRTPRIYIEDGVIKCDYVDGSVIPPNGDTIISLDELKDYILGESGGSIGGDSAGGEIVDDSSKNTIAIVENLPETAEENQIVLLAEKDVKEKGTFSISFKTPTEYPDLSNIPDDCCCGFLIDTGIDENVLHLDIVKCSDYAVESDESDKMYAFVVPLILESGEIERVDMVFLPNCTFRGTSYQRGWYYVDLDTFEVTSVNEEELPIIENSVLNHGHNHTLENLKYFEPVADVKSETAVNIINKGLYIYLNGKWEIFESSNNGENSSAYISIVNELPETGTERQTVLWLEEIIKDAGTFSISLKTPTEYPDLSNVPERNSLDFVKNDGDDYVDLRVLEVSELEEVGFVIETEETDYVYAVNDDSGEISKMLILLPDGVLMGNPINFGWYYVNTDTFELTQINEENLPKYTNVFYDGDIGRLKERTKYYEAIADIIPETTISLKTPTEYPQIQIIDAAQFVTTDGMHVELGFTDYDGAIETDKDTRLITVQIYNETYEWLGQFVFFPECEYLGQHRSQGWYSNGSLNDTLVNSEDLPVFTTADFPVSDALENFKNFFASVVDISTATDVVNKGFYTFFNGKWQIFEPNNNSSNTITTVDSSSNTITTVDSLPETGSEGQTVLLLEKVVDESSATISFKTPVEYPTGLRENHSEFDNGNVYLSVTETAEQGVESETSDYLYSIEVPDENGEPRNLVFVPDGTFLGNFYTQGWYGVDTNTYELTPLSDSELPTATVINFPTDWEENKDLYKDVLEFTYETSIVDKGLYIYHNGKWEILSEYATKEELKALSDRFSAFESEVTEIETLIDESGVLL